MKKILRDLRAGARLHPLAEAIRDRIKGTPDGLPVPPAVLRSLVSGDPNDTRASFFEMGGLCAQSIKEALEKTGVEIESFDAILDFGCGCGRTIRHFRTLPKTQLYGTDYNPKLVDWCARNLPFARFGLNQLHPPLDYPGATFDLVYAFSVFTHMPEALQFAWMRELSRLIKPAGYLVISTLPLELLPESQRTGPMVVRKENQPGTNACLAYHTFAYVEEKLSKGFEIIEFIEGGVGQDFYLLRKLTEGDLTQSGPG